MNIFDYLAWLFFVVFILIALYLRVKDLAAAIKSRDKGRIKMSIVISLIVLGLITGLIVHVLNMQNN